MAAEEDFIKDMDHFITGYMIPLKDSSLLNRGEANTIFNNIAEIKEENNNLLAAMMAANVSNGLEMIGTLLLERVRSTPPAPSTTLSLFLTLKCSSFPYPPCFKSSVLNLFIPYCSNFPAAIALNREIQERPDIAVISANFAKDQQGAVERYMSKPLQHISKLPSLIQKVLELTSPQHPDQPALQNGDISLLASSSSSSSCFSSSEFLVTQCSSISRTSGSL